MGFRLGSGRAALVLAAVLAPAGMASASVWTADFSGPSLDPELNSTSDPGYAISVGGGALTFSYSAPAPPSPATAFAQVNTNFRLTGNYIAQATVDVSGISKSVGSSFISGDFGINTATDYAALGPYALSNGYYTNDFSVINGVYNPPLVQPKISSTMNLRLERLGDTIIESIAPAGSSKFKIINAATDGGFSEDAGVSLNEFGTTTIAIDNSTVKYSNFSITYGSDPAIPQDLAGLIGGPENAPTVLAAGSVGSISAPIAGDGDAEFYRFNWHGGDFSAIANIAGANPLGSYQFELLNPDGSVNQALTLDASDNFLGAVGEYLARGRYTIGVIADSPFDPQLYLNFATPVSGGVPEPRSWAVFLIGTGWLGAMARRRRPRLA
jgi:hypothetical protein